MWTHTFPSASPHVMVEILAARKRAAGYFFFTTPQPYAVEQGVP